MIISKKSLSIHLFFTHQNYILLINLFAWIINVELANINKQIKLQYQMLSIFHIICNQQEAAESPDAAFYGLWDYGLWEVLWFIWQQNVLNPTHVEKQTKCINYGVPVSMNSFVSHQFKVIKYDYSCMEALSGLS